MYQDAVTGRMLRELRERAGVSLGVMAARANYSKAHLSRVETGGRTVPAELVSAYERVLVPEVQRRGFVTGLIALSMGYGALADEIYSSVAASDAEALAQAQTTHGTDLMIASRVERTVAPMLKRWMMDGPAVLRVNAAGILAKIPGQDYAPDVARALAHDSDVRRLYSAAVLARVCGLDWGTAERAAVEPALIPGPTSAARKLSVEVMNTSDAGARWCAANLLRELSPALGEV